MDNRTFTCRGDPRGAGGLHDELEAYVKNVDGLCRKLARIAADQHEAAASLRRAAAALRAAGSRGKA